MKDNWKGFALVTIVSFVMGGGVSSWFTSVQAAKMEEKLTKRIQEGEISDSKNYDLLMSVSLHLAEVKVELKYIKEALDRLE